MPLLRYEIGDYAVAAQGTCPCGRTLPLLGGLVGRGVNLSRMSNGSLLSPWVLTGPLRTCSGVKQFQIVQRAIDHVAIRYVADQPIRSENEAYIQTRFSEFLGENASITFERVPEIARASNGKFMVALSELSSPPMKSTTSQPPF